MAKRVRSNRRRGRNGNFIPLELTELNRALRAALKHRTAAAAFASLAALGLATAPVPAQADVEIFTVNTIADSAPDICGPSECTLREAIIEANDVDPAGEVDEIVFASDVTGTIVLNGTELVVSDAVNIIGPSTKQLTISGDANNSGIFYTGEPAVIKNLLLSGGFRAVGGAIYAIDDLTLEGVTLNQNTAQSQGGAVALNCPTGACSLQVTNSTFSDNVVQSSGDGGGGLAVISGDATLVNTTLTGNTAVYGGGFAVENGSITLTNTIVAGNTATNTASEEFYVSGTGQLSLYYSLVQGNYQGSPAAASGNIFGQNPNLGPLEDNGGPTRTHAIGNTSPAYNAGDPSPVMPLAYDQRGPSFPRTVFGRTDMGAYELQDLQTGPNFVVTTTDDHDDARCDANECTLREAVNRANKYPNGLLPDTITFASSVTGTILLDIAAYSNLQVYDALTISGPGADKLAVSGQDIAPKNINDNYVHGGIFTASVDLTVEALSLVNGYTRRAGGAIYSSANLYLDGVTIRSSKADRLSSTFPFGNGGGVFAAGDLTLKNSTVNGNSATRDGGGFFVVGDATLNNATVSGNTADIYNGGFEVGGNATLTHATVTFNTGTFTGGFSVGTHAPNGTLTLTNSIVANNNSIESVRTVDYCFICNTYYIPQRDEFYVGNLYHGYSDYDPVYLIPGTLQSYYSLVKGSYGPTPSGGSTGNIFGSDPGLEILSSNGGPTRTHAIDATSPAYNAGDQSPTSPPAYDQRGPGFPREAFGRADMGAFEVQAPTAGPNFTVTSTDEPGDGVCSATACTLRDAVLTSNAHPNGASGDTITFASGVTGTIYLDIQKYSNLEVTGELTITGPGADQLVVDGQDTAPKINLVAYENGGIINADHGLTLENLTLAHGKSGENGGAVYSFGQLTLHGVTIRDSEAGAYGGGFHANGDAMLSNTTVSGNTATSDGGGFYVDGADATLTNSTISGNTTQGDGGGFNVHLGNATLAHSTVSGNTANYSGGGFSVSGNVVGNGEVTLLNSIVANNTASSTTPSDEFDLRAGTPSGSYSLVEGSYDPAGGYLNGNGNITGQDPGLGPLADNGGHNFTHAISSSSPAYNAGDPAFTGPPNFDQRGLGFPRVAYGVTDMGAYEVPDVQIPPHFVVNTTADHDDGACDNTDCTLREAVSTANANLNGPATVDNITFAAGVTGTIYLDIGAYSNLEVTDELTMTGPGADQLVVDGQGIAPEDSESNDESGGIIEASATLSLSGLTLAHGNSVLNGGAIYGSAPLYLEEVSVRDSDAGNAGGGIAAQNRVELLRSTLSGNAATSGAGLLAGGDDAVLTHVTVSANTANSGQGGGILVNSGDLTLSHSTISGNTAQGEGAGFFVVGNVNVYHNIVANNVSNTSTTSDEFYASGSLLAKYNLVEGSFQPAPFFYAGNIFNADPNLGPLADNGGPTWTHAIDASSAAYNAGDPSFASPPDFDQRGPGFSRIASGQLDIGAFEFQGTIPVALTVSPLPANLPEDGSSGAMLSACLPTSVLAAETVTITLGITGIATPGTDHDLANPTTFSIDSGQNCGQVSMTAIDDGTVEGDETVVVNITGVGSGSGDYVEEGAQQVNATIIDDDVAGSSTVTLSLTASPFAESGGVATVTAALDTTNAQTVTVDLGFGGAAIAGTDFTASADQIQIAPGNTTGFVTLTGITQPAVEGNEDVVVDITSVTNATEGSPGQVTATIVDNQSPSPPGCVFASDFVIIANQILNTDENLTACISITLGPGVDITVPADVEARAGQYVSINGGFSVQQGATFAIVIDPGAGGFSKSLVTPPLALPESNGKN